MSLVGIVRYLEIGPYGERTRRQLIIKADHPQPPAADGAEWRIDPTFNAADEILKSSGFKHVLASALKKGYEIISAR